MNTKLHTEWTVADICDGFVYYELEGNGSKCPTAYPSQWEPVTISIYENP